MKIRRGRCAPGLLAVLLLLLTTACNSESNQTQSVTTKTGAGTSTAPPAVEVSKRKNALVRFVHAVPGVAALDLFVNDSKAFTETSYKKVTPFHEVPTEGQTFRLRLAGQEGAEPVAEDKESFDDGRHYTALAIPVEAGAILSKSTGPSVELRFLKDDLAAPARGKAKVRVVQTSPDLGAADIYLAGRSEPLLKGVEFDSGAKYAEVEPAEGALEVRRTGENMATLSIPAVRFEPGKIYTVFILGRTKGASKLESVIIEDQFGATGAPTPAAP